MEWLQLIGSIKSYVSFKKRALQKRRYSAKETYNFIDPTDRSHLIHAPYITDYRANFLNTTLETRR